MGQVHKYLCADCFVSLKVRGNSTALRMGVDKERGSI